MAATLRKSGELGWKNYLATNNYPEILQNLEKLGIASYFTGCIVSSHIGFEKPRAEFFHCARELAGSPETCWMIGDNPTADIGGAKKAGMKTIFVHGDCCPDADHICQSLSEILPVLEKS